jgi:hypothetical protein
MSGALPWLLMSQTFGRALRGISCALFLVLGACGQPATAQSFEDFSDDVLLYVRNGQSDHPSIVLYDPKAVQANAQAKQPVVELTLDFSAATERWDYRAAIDERFDELLKGAPARLAATHTEPQQGRRSYLLVSADHGRVTAALEGITPPSDVTATSRTLQASELEAWGPTPSEFQDAQDERVRQALAKSGDDGTKPRMVDFFFYSGDQPSLRKFKSLSQGCSVRALSEIARVKIRLPAARKVPRPTLLSHSQRPLSALTAACGRSGGRHWRTLDPRPKEAVQPHKSYTSEPPTARPPPRTSYASSRAPRSLKREKRCPN